MKNILEFIKKYRNKSANTVLLNEIIFILFISSIFSIFILYIEKIFYLSSYNRKLYFTFFISFILIAIIYSILKWSISFYSLFNNNTNEIIAKKIGDQFNIIRDRLLNVIQLNKISPNLDLTQFAIQNLVSDLKLIKLTNLHFNYNKNKIISHLVVTVLSLILINFTLKDSLSRIVNYNIYYSPPTPFSIINIDGDYEALSGDTIKINFMGEGNLPDSINFHWVNSKKHYIQKIAKINNKYFYSFNNIRSNISYWAEVKPESWISKWDSIGTNKNTISVKERPKIIIPNFKIIPPKYTKSEEQIINGSNLNQIKILNGSNVSLNFIANKNLNQAWMLLNDKRINLKIKENIITGDFIFNENSTLSIFCIDENLVSNLNPTQYTLLKINDNPPVQSIYLPFSEFEIDESYEIIININIQDDYGIKDTYIEYEIISPEYFSSKSSKGNWQLINNMKDDLKSININKKIDISGLKLSMGDEIHFWFISKDHFNITKSDKFIGRFPTLGDMFAKIENYEEKNNEWVDDIQESLNEIFETTNEAKLDILKDKDLSVEKENNVSESIDKANEIFEELEKIQENMEKIQEAADKNNLFDKNLMEKFDHFQKLLQDMMTPELLESMSQLQQAMQNIDQKELLQALENFEFNMEQFENELDRFIEMFEMAQSEQKLDELNQSINNMIEKQNMLIEQIQSDPDKNKMLTSRSNKQEERFEDFEQLLNEASDAMESSSKQISEEMKTLANHSTMSDTKNNLNNTTEQLSNNKMDDAKKESEKSKDNLEEISEQIKQIKEDFKNENIQELSKEFILIIDNLLTISNQQEEIIFKSKLLRSNSPYLREINSVQNNINRELNQIMKAMLSLSNKTFFMKPIISKSFGKIKTSITSAISNFEQKKISPGKKNQINAIININTTIQLLLDALNEMQNSEQASGFEQFMESLESMSKKQQGINQGTMQLNQMGMMQQQGLMEQLQSQQQKLKEELNELMGEFPGQNNGTMEKITNDMDNIIQDFSDKNITQKTIERQEQIISRMLDNQKSLAQRDFSNQRKSQAGQKFEYTGSKLLPDNLGQKNLLLMNAMESAMQEGHSNEYNQLIRNYFLNLQKNNANEK